MSHDTTSPAGSTPARSEDFARLVSALFDTRDHAETARADLIAAGIRGEDIAIDGTEGMTPARETGEAPHHAGFWETIKELFMPDEDRFAFAEGVRRGGVTISVRTDTASHDRVVELLDRDGAVNLDEREESWRGEGWSGYTGRDPIAEPPARTTAASETDPEDPIYAPPSSATAGFGASQADHFPVAAAPEVESPGALPEAERIPAPDALYPAAAAASTSSAVPSVTPMPPVGPADVEGRQPLGPDSDMAPSTPTRVGIRDISHGRPRIRSYVTDPQSPEPIPREGADR